MNFENYIGKRVRIHTNIIDEDNGRYKVIEGTFSGWDSIGTTQYIIIDEETYPEMCITKFGLIPETKIVNKVEVEEEFIPAIVLQVDPLDIINNAVDEIELEEEKSKPLLRIFSSEWIAKASAVTFIMAIIIISSISVPSYNNYLSDDTAYEFDAIPTTKPSNCKLTTYGLCCNGRLA